MEFSIEADKIGASFDGKVVLKDICLQAEKGEIFGLLGPSGAGKTTLIKILTGQIKPTEGKARILNKDAQSLCGTDYRKIGIMMDNFGLYERFSCYDNLKLFAKLYRMPNQAVEEALQKVGLEEARKTAVMNLSKGMRSRLMLARVLIQNPQVLFLDEPTSGLDPATAEHIHQVLQMERKRGVTIFLTTHNMAEAEKLCRHVALLNEGSIVESGTPASLCRRYNHQKRLKLHFYDGTDMELPSDRSAAEELKQYFEREAVETIHSTEPNLETVFIELTGRSLE